MTIALCLDISLACTGWIAVRLPMPAAESVRHGDTFIDRNPDPTLVMDGIRWCGEWPTPVGDSMTARAGAVAQHIDSMLSVLKPQVVAAEMAVQMFSTRRTDARSMQMQQWSYAVVSATCWQRGTPIIQVSPGPPKATLTGNRNANKTAVASALALRYSVGMKSRTQRDWPEGWGSDHVRDALATAIWLDGQARVYGDTRTMTEALLRVQKDRPMADWIARRSW